MTGKHHSDSEIWLRLLSRINPYILEILGGGPLGLHLGRFRDTDLRASKPDPWPSKEMGAAVLQGFALRAFLTRDFGRFMTDIENWCPTPPEDREIPVPQGSGEPIPDPNWQQFLGAAVAAVELARGLEGEAAEQLTKAADYLFEAGQSA